MTGVTSQFLEDAPAWDAAHYNPGEWRNIMRACLSRVELPAAPRVLELGAGSGHATVALLELLPHAQVVANDISPNMLAILKSRTNGSCRVVCCDAAEMDVEPGSYDFVFGAAVLHHLIDPLTAVRLARRALKPGRCAIFLEPFELGASLMAMLCERIAEVVPERIRRDLLPWVADVRGRTAGTILREALDDKWLFSRAGLERMASDAGFRSVEMFCPDPPLSDYYRVYVGILARLRGISEPLPEYALSIADEWDRAFGMDAKRDLAVEGGVIFR